MIVFIRERKIRVAVLWVRKIREAVLWERVLIITMYQRVFMSY